MENYKKRGAAKQGADKVAVTLLRILLARLFLQERPTRLQLSQRLRAWQRLALVNS